jgi:hypothetical protein
MDGGSFRFGVGQFECVSVSDGALNYHPRASFPTCPLSASKRACYTSIC